jgi:hypothetical protein
MAFELQTTKARVRNYKAYTMLGPDLSIGIYDFQSEPDSYKEINDANDGFEAASNKVPYYGTDVASTGGPNDAFQERSPMLVHFAEGTSLPNLGSAVQPVSSLLWPKVGLSLEHSRIRVVSASYNFSITSNLLVTQGFITVVTPSNRIGLSLGGKTLTGATSLQGVTYYSIPLASLVAGDEQLTITWFPTSPYNTWYAIGDWTGQATSPAPGTNYGPSLYEVSALQAAVFITGAVAGVSVLCEFTGIVEIASSKLPTNTRNEMADMEPHVSGAALSETLGAKIYANSEEKRENSMAAVATHMHQTGAPYGLSIKEAVPQKSIWRRIGETILPSVFRVGGALLGGPVGAAAGGALANGLSGLLSRAPTVRSRIKEPHRYRALGAPSASSVAQAHTAPAAFAMTSCSDDKHRNCTPDSCTIHPAHAAPLNKLCPRYGNT